WHRDPRDAAGHRVARPGRRPAVSVIRTAATGHPLHAMQARLPMPLTVADPAPTRQAVSSPDRLTTLFHQHFDLVWRTVRRLGVPPEAVDDAAQEVFVIASRRLASIEQGKERAFLYGTAVRVASTARRTRSRRRQADPREGEEATDPVDTAPAVDEL